MMPNKNALEWAVFAVSLTLILFVIGLLSYEHVTSEGLPPSMRIEAGAPRPAGDGYAVPLDVYNDGDTTAEEVSVEIVLEAGGTEEKGTAVLAFVPRHSHRRAWVTFRRNPAGGRLTPRVLGYREP